MYRNFNLRRGAISHIFYVDFAFFGRRQYRFDKIAHRHTIRHIANYERAIIKFFDVRANFHHATALAIVVATHIEQTARWEIGEKLELFIAQNGD